MSDREPVEATIRLSPCAAGIARSSDRDDAAHGVSDPPVGDERGRRSPQGVARRLIGLEAHGHAGRPPLGEKDQGGIAGCRAPGSAGWCGWRGRTRRLAAGDRSEELRRRPPLMSGRAPVERRIPLPEPEPPALADVVSRGIGLHARPRIRTAGRRLARRRRAGWALRVNDRGKRPGREHRRESSRHHVALDAPDPAGLEPGECAHVNSVEGVGRRHEI